MATEYLDLEQLERDGIVKNITYTTGNEQSFMVMAGNEYVVGYAQTEKPNQARQVAMKRGVVDGYEYADLRALRAPALDCRAFDFINVAELDEQQEQMLRGLGLLTGAGDEVWFSAKPQGVAK